MRAFCDLQGREAGLGRCLGRGGEGAVYSVPMWPGSVAKIYARRPDDQSSRKLGAMVQLGTEALTTFAAWPENLVLDPPTGDVVGFLMPRIDGHREIHALYGPTDRKTAFPDASWALLVTAARNVAAAFQTVHAHGHVIGDVNQGNVVVSRKGTVRLIDCDSFQITHLGRTYPCRVGVPLFTPPELQGRRLDGVVRTADHDRFGLAVLVFQLLFMGRHPFAGRHPERAVPVETAIREGIFAFGAEAAGKGWQPPPFSLGLRDLCPQVAQLFERAFGREAAIGGPRPTAADWLNALDQLGARLTTCGDDPRHVHARADGSCPWCRIENEGGPSFFYLPPGADPDAFDLDAVWKAIEAVRSPGPAELPPPPASESAWPPRPTALQAARWLRCAMLAAALTFGVSALWYGHPAAVLGLVGLLALRPPRWERAAAGRRRQELLTAEENRRRLEAQWDSMCREIRFVDARRQLEDARAAFERLPGLEESEWEELTDRFREKRLPSHLRTFALEFARIPGLGRAELARLASRGVTTAADLTPERLMAIRGVDLGLVKSLLLFKGLATRSFRLDSVTGIPGKDRKARGDAQRLRREELMKKLLAGPLLLADIRRQTLAWRDVIGRALANVHRQIARLRAEGIKS